MSRKKSESSVAKLVEKRLGKTHHDLVYTKDPGRGTNPTILQRARTRLTKTIELLKDKKREDLKKFHAKLVNVAPFMFTAMEYEDLDFDSNLAEKLLRHLI